jgi:malto-oligosyltrehalose trehalohydrolase
MKRKHSMPFGAEVSENGEVRFRLWAPKAKSVDLCLENSKEEKLPLSRLDQGWFELTTRAAAAVGTRYRFQIDGNIKVPDPASRFQPADVHGPSEVIDPKAFEWTDDSWRGRPWEEAVVYELHLGTFTPEGTFRAVEQKLDYLRDLGVTAIELMPLSDFPGKRNWGYDGVLPFAPDGSYGRPEDLKHLIQAAHAKGLMIFLDVVYNHFGPDGNYLSIYSPQFFTDRHHTPWGDAINFDGPESRAVRDYFIHNALYWLEEYHFDGLRLDAVHAIVDDSKPDILTELAQTIRGKFGSERDVHLMLENGDNGARYLRRDPQGRTTLYDAQWNDDIHHAAHVLITKESDGYYSDYFQQPLQHLCRCLTQGFSYQGQFSDFHGAPRGEPCKSLPLSAFISFLQNHDQIGNRAFGERISQVASPHALKAAMEVLLLAPSPPLLFMGEEFAASSPFLFFCNFSGDLAAAVTNGRRNEFARFATFNSAEMREKIPNPNAEQTFLQSKLDWTSLQREPHTTWLKLYQQLLTIRREKIVPHLQGTSKPQVQNCSEDNRSLAIDWNFGDGAVLHLYANLSDKPFVLPDSKSNGQIYSSSLEVSQDFGHGHLPAWSVVWLLK